MKRGEIYFLGASQKWRHRKKTFPFIKDHKK